jgi:photosystem II stability/assembly factor-like uncharacterized protein
LTHIGLLWAPEGPRPTTGGQVEGIVDGEVVGAIKAVAAHPTNPDLVYVGSVNGGVWRTRNAQNATPTWEQLTDAQRSLSIGALEFDPTDSTHRTLVAGTGRFSSLSRVGGSLIGVLRTTDGGATWTTLDGGGQISGVHICDVAPRGQAIVIATNPSGVFRSTDAGGSWMQVSGAAGTGLPAGISFALAGVPKKPAHLFAHIGTAGIFRSTDTGATWSKVSDPSMDALLSLAVNVKIAVGALNGGIDLFVDNVYVATAGPGGRLSGLFRSGDSGSTWTALDLPSTIEAGGVSVGIHPGGQAGIHLSLAADRVNHYVVYIGGDRQPNAQEGGLPSTAPPFPNVIGARAYSGRLFRVDAGEPPGSQSAHLTHSNTASNTAPHADSRSIAVDAQGDLIEGDDGGVYRRRSPLTNADDWVSMNGDLQTTEFHSAAWDAISGTAIGGAQDTGTPQQPPPPLGPGSRWPSVSTADGGVVLAETTTIGVSVRYSSFQFLLDFRREVYIAGFRQYRYPVLLWVLGGGAPVQAQFYTPLELNQMAATRLIIGAANGVYESDDQGDTVREVGPGIQVNSRDAAPIAYGAQDNLDVLYVGSGSSVFVRTAADPTPLAVSSSYPGTARVLGIAIPPAESNTAFAIDAGTVFHTTDAGVTWTDVTGNLLALGGIVLRSVTYCADLYGGSVIVGTNAGVFAADGPAFDYWSMLGSGLPMVPVLRLRYSTRSQVLLAGTLGRGAWTLDIP